MEFTVKDVEFVATFFDKAQHRPDITQAEAWEFVKSLGYSEDCVRRGFNMYLAER